MFLWLSNIASVTYCHKLLNVGGTSIQASHTPSPFSSVMPYLAPTRALLNPHFEGYKLSFSPSPNMRQFLLPQLVSQARSGLSSLGFQKVASRVRHNHLGVGDDIAVYVSENGGVFAIDVNDDSSPIRQVFQLPEFVLDPKRTQGEYPGAAHVVSSLWFITDGHGGAYLIRISKDGPGQLLSTFEHIVDNDTIPTPFQLHSVAVIDPGTALAIVSTTVPHVKLPRIQSKDKDQHLFDIWGLGFALSDDTKPVDFVEKPSPMITLFRRRGTHIPFYSSYFPAVGSFLILSGSTYTNIEAPPPEEYTPSPDEYAPIPRLGDVEEGSFDLNSSSSIPPPYSWTQTNDSVTVAFALPSTITKESIRVLFGKNTISLVAGGPTPLPQPFYSNAPLWDSIDVGSSLWTWERPSADSADDASHPKAGLLTLHLEKTNQGTRWSSLFAQGFENAEIPETVDPSELAHIRDMLDKYTATIKDGGGGADLGHGVPSLFEGERDVSVDEIVGKRAFCTWVSVKDEVTPKPLTDDIPTTILSVPIPVSTSGKDSERPFTLIAKHDIDGALFSFETSSWAHTQTYSALSFVLASKQDTRFTYHYQHPPSNGTSSSSGPSPQSGDGVVLAFESGSRSSGSANVYTYHSSKRGDRQARQGVFQMRPGSGALVGVGVVHSDIGQPVLICLCEKEVAFCRDVTEQARAPFSLVDEINQMDRRYERAVHDHLVKADSTSNHIQTIAILEYEDSRR